MRDDIRRIATIQGLRAVGYGFASVTLGALLARAGLGDWQVGLVFASMLAGMGLATLGVAVAGDRIGRRRAYLALLLVMAVAGAVFALTAWLPALVVAALTGTLSTDANESGPISSLEQAMLGQAPADERSAVFGRYNAIAFFAGSVGALLAGGPAAVRHLGLVPSAPATSPHLLLGITLLGIACAAVASRLSPAVDTIRGGERPGLRPETRPKVARLAALFGLDSLASGFVTQAFLVYWLSRRFGAPPDVLGVLFFATGVLQSASALASGWLGRRIGLLNTMVFTHLPANLCLAAVALAPAFPLAIALLVVRYALSNMDTPAKQAYVAAMVRPEERTAAASSTNVVRYLVKPFGPILAGTGMGLALGAPLLIAGGLKVVYDVLLYASFRGEAAAMTPARASSSSAVSSSPRTSPRT